MRKAMGLLISILFVFLLISPSSSLALADASIQNLVRSGVPPRALQVALRAYHWAVERGHVHKPIMTLINFNESSAKKRLWIINMKTGHILFNGLVAHGKGSGNLYASHFSDRPGSKASVLGAMVTGETYEGKHGLELRIEGLEKGLNEKVYNRAIIFHSAYYVTPLFLKEYGYLGRSHGCFVLNPTDAHYVINKIKGGSFVFSYASAENNDPNFRG